jgi:hypothetical protein
MSVDKIVNHEGHEVSRRIDSYMLRRKADRKADGNVGTGRDVPLILDTMPFRFNRAMTRCPRYSRQDADATLRRSGCWLV